VKQHPHGGGHSKKHAGTKKHAHHAKHHPSAQRAHHQGAKQHHPKTAHTKAKHPKHTKARALVLPGLVDVACCASEALAASLRLSGWPVGAPDVLDLYKHLTDSPDTGAAISATLEAAYRWGLAGVRPVSFAPVDLDDPAAVILGLELPGPHAVAVAPEGCWLSWGAHYCPCEFPDAVIEEAWAVTWP
jgi:hypothetical protein